MKYNYEQDTNNAGARLSSAKGEGTSDLSSGSKSGSSSTTVTALGGDGFGLSRDLDQLLFRARASGSEGSSALSREACSLSRCVRCLATYDALGCFVCLAVG